MSLKKLGKKRMENLSQDLNMEIVICGSRSFLAKLERERKAIDLNTKWHKHKPII